MSTVASKQVTFRFLQEDEFNSFTKGVKPRKGLELEITLTDARTGQNRYFFVPALPRRGNNTPWRGEFHCIMMAENGGLYVNASEVDLVNRECARNGASEVKRSSRSKRSRDVDGDVRMRSRSSRRAGDVRVKSEKRTANLDSRSTPHQTNPNMGKKVYRFEKALEYSLGKRPNRFARELIADAEKLIPPEPLYSDDLPPCVCFQQKLHVWYSRKPGHSYVQLDMGERYTIYSPFAFTHAELSLFYSTKDARVQLETEPLVNYSGALQQRSSAPSVGLSIAAQLSGLRSLASGNASDSASPSPLVAGVDAQQLMQCETRLQEICRKFGYVDNVSPLASGLDGIKQYLDVLEQLIPAHAQAPTSSGRTQRENMTCSDQMLSSASNTFNGPRVKRIKREPEMVATRYVAPNNMDSTLPMPSPSGHYSAGGMSSPTSCGSMSQFLRDDMSDHSHNSSSGNDTPPQLPLPPLSAYIPDLPQPAQQWNAGMPQLEQTTRASYASGVSNQQRGHKRKACESFGTTPSSYKLGFEQKRCITPDNLSSPSSASPFPGVDMMGDLDLDLDVNMNSASSMSQHQECGLPNFVAYTPAQAAHAQQVTSSLPNSFALDAAANSFFNTGVDLDFPPPTPI